MNPIHIPGPIPAAIEAQIKAHLRGAISLLALYHLDLDAEDREEFGRTGLGPESLPFADTALRLMNTFPDVLPRSIKDADIVVYGERLATVTTCQDLLADANAVVATLHNLDIVAGSGLMETARAAYKAAKDDAGRTAGVEALVQEMKQRFARKADAAPTPPTP